MKKYLSFLLFLGFYTLSAQPKMELTPDGFASVTIPRPAKTSEKLIDLAKAWAPYYNKDEYDVYNVTLNSLSIDAMKENAFYYRNRGEVYKHRVKYEMNVGIGETTCTIHFRTSRCESLIRTRAIYRERLPATHRHSHIHANRDAPNNQVLRV